VTPVQPEGYPESGFRRRGRTTDVSGSSVSGGWQPP